MISLTRKQREIQNRIDLILQTGKEILQCHGYRGLTMNKLAQITEYSKGTIYQHFGCKEEVVYSLVTRGTQRLLEMLNRVAGAEGSCRLRFTLASEAYFLFWQLYPAEFSLIQTIKSGSIREKISDRKQKELETLERQLMSTMCSIIEDGVAAGELCLPENTHAQELAFGSWSILYGALSVTQDMTEISHVGIENIMNSIRKSFQIFLDGCNWQPDSNDYAPDQVMSIARNELFCDEFRILNQ